MSNKRELQRFFKGTDVTVVECTRDGFMVRRGDMTLSIVGQIGTKSFGTGGGKYETAYLQYNIAGKGE